jgi:DNA-binding transcriptional ArsR family regulator
MAHQRLTVKARAEAACTFDDTAPQTPLHRANNPYRLDLIFQALADRHRRLMVATLSTGPETASELAGLAAATLSAGMKHIQLLEASGLIHTEKVGRIRMCSLNHAALEMPMSWLNKASRQPHRPPR